eukprot:CAMPEP_0182474774 /NCGR_PEP_ID=MMETSP1319-20130603/26255_1 /TAXON_ID=172717 /ORGANISM="Bolidomonas pacifica, Strain RCC208" /LENGTH=59 /DNA_ID=CAMNT_0024675703 /DNA_START=45 /DNA_END=224 /DNA_ORIENTATION=+
MNVHISHIFAIATAFIFAIIGRSCLPSILPSVGQSVVADAEILLVGNKAVEDSIIRFSQ